MLGSDDLDLYSGLSGRRRGGWDAGRPETARTVAWSSQLFLDELDEPERRKSGRLGPLDPTDSKFVKVDFQLVLGAPVRVS